MAKNKIKADEAKSTEPPNARPTKSTEMQEQDQDQQDCRIATDEMGGPKEEMAFPIEIQGHIGKQLRHIYGKMLAEPLPDKFKDLLDQLAKSERKS